MTKGKARMSSGSSAPPQPRSLRMRRRESPCDDTSKTGDIQATLHHQDTEGNNPAVDVTLQKCHQPPQQESAVILTPQSQPAEQPSLPQQEAPVAEEKHAAAADVMGETFEGEEETTGVFPADDPQLEGCRPDHRDDANKSGEDEEEGTSAEERNRTSPQTSTNQLHVFLPESEEADGSFSATLEENSHSHLEGNQEELSDVCPAYMKEIRPEAAESLPAKKKRRMGTCGLTEKERTYFLQAQKRENRQNGPDRVEKQICNNTADFQAQEEMISSPVFPSSAPTPVCSVAEQNEAERQLQASQCGRDDRAETEEQIAVAASDGNGAMCDPGCSEAKSREADGGKVSDPEHTADKESDPPAGEEEEQQEDKGHTADIVTKELQEQMEDVSATVDQSPAITFYSDPDPLFHVHENEEAGEPAADLQGNSVTRTSAEESAGDAGDGVGAEAGSSSTGASSGGFNGVSVELCEAAVMPTGSERKDSCDSEDEPGAAPSPLDAKHPQTRDTSDPFGSENLDYVSDSQLNTITLADELVMEREEGLSSPNYHEDATDLICGLIRELSSLNRKVMATHRELENLRRCSKSSRSSTR